MFGFPSQSRPVNFSFKNNLLKTATFQLAFSSIGSVETYRERIAEAIHGNFPLIKFIVEQRFTVKPANTEQKTPIISSEGAPGGFEFRSEDGMKILVVTHEALTLTILGQGYTNYEVAKAEFEGSLYRVAGILGVATFNRVAIRKVNLVFAERQEGVPSSLSALMQSVFNQSLVSNTTSIPSAAMLASSVSNARFVSGDSSLNIIYGLLPQELEHGTRQLMLDIDVFNTKPNIQLGETKSIFLDINNEIFDIFMWSLQPNVRTILEA